MPDIPFAQFVPLIKNVADIHNKVTNLYSTAQHNKKITKLLMQRISAANFAVSILQDDELYTLNHYHCLRRIIQVIQKMKTFIEEITQYNTVQKFLGAKTIETQFNELRKEYDSSVISLDLKLTVDFKINAGKENRILQKDIEELLKFQSALSESMNMEEKVADTNKKIDVDRKVSDTMNVLIEKVSEMTIIMQIFGVNQNKIDNIFNECLLSFEEFEAALDERRSERLRKYIKNREEFAFKIIIKEDTKEDPEVKKYLNQVKNQVTILKKLRDCQNIIRFYGLTFDGNTHYLVTEWEENGNLREYIDSKGQNIDIKLRIKFAYDIALGLNFLNSVKIVHRDIRAENIVITKNDVAKITNFILSRRFDDNLSVDKEYVRYCAPEILRKLKGEGEKKSENKKYDIKCEVYGFGILLWEIAECRVPYQFDDFMKIIENVTRGYREPFTLGTAIPNKYQILVNKAVDHNPGLRPTFAKMLIDLQDLKNSPTTLSYSSDSIRSPIRKTMTEHTSIDKEIDKAVKEHKKNIKEKGILYKVFDTYANIGVPKAKYWKAYFILKNWSDLTFSEDEKLKIAAALFKEAADYGDEYPDAQLHYAAMLMQGNGVEKDEKEAIEYFRKAAKNNHVVAMFNVGTYYLSNDDKELGKYYLAKAASEKYELAINYCRNYNISY